MGQVEVAYSEDLGPAEEHCAPEPTALVIISGEQDCSLSWRETLSHPTNLGPKQPGPCMLCTPSQSSPSSPERQVASPTSGEEQAERKTRIVQDLIWPLSRTSSG